MLAAVVSGFVLACFAPLVHRLAGRAAGVLLALLPLGLAGYFLGWLADVSRGETILQRTDWMPSLGIALSFSLDGLALLMALLIVVIGALVIMYASSYLVGHEQLGRLYALLLMFMASMLGVVLADNLLALFVFWELTSISSYLLIGFEHDRPAARRAALQALLVTGAGGLALMAGLLLLGQIGGSYEISALRAQADAVRANALYGPLLALVLVGALTKSAQFPFHFWLPNAMEAPTPISAYLHSATMVKAGVYLLARLNPILGGTPWWTGTLVAVGGATALLGAWLAVQQTDLKRILAYSTVSALGMLTLLTGIGTPQAAEALVLMLLAHALYKGTLFLVAGAIDHEAGTRDIAQLGGLLRPMPVTAMAALLAAMSMAGLPPLAGFVAKELMYESLLGGPWWIGASLAMVVAASMLTVAAAGMIGVAPFWARAGALPKHPHEAPWLMFLGPLALAGMGLALGVMPAAAEQFLGAAAQAIHPHPGAALHLKLWHGWNMALGLSLLTVAVGLAVYVARHRARTAGERFQGLARYGPSVGYERCLAALNWMAAWQTHWLQSGYLRYYLMIVLATLVGLVGYPLASRTERVIVGSWGDVQFYEGCLIGLIVAAALMAARTQPRLAAIATLGVVGYSVALLFVLLGAPDLAITQVLVETLTVILFVLVFYHLAPTTPLSGRAGRLRDAVLAGAVGLLMGCLVLVATHLQFEPPISTYFVENSLAKAHGRNIVNVILVDFRGLDTLGEITVLAVAGIGVFALMKLRPRAAAAAHRGKDDASPEASS